jgi:hypothetical protein
MIGRVWRGWTTQENADRYEHLLNSQIFPSILAKGIVGFERIELFRRDLPQEVEFMTVMWFTSIHAVKTFAGADHEAAYVPTAAREVLARFDGRAQHYEVRTQRSAV